MTTHLTFDDLRSDDLRSDDDNALNPCDMLPGYNDYVDQLTPEQFIKMFWNDATDDMRGCMIDYIDEHPFDGSLRYIAEWTGYLGRIYGQLI